MILEYVWIEDYGVINNQGFNFNPNVFYHFDKETGRLTKETRNTLPADFFNITNDTVVNVSALVGANGTGKSSVLVFIARLLAAPHALNGIVVTNNGIINKTQHTLMFHGDWNGAPPLYNRLDLINSYRKNESLRTLDALPQGKVNPIHLTVLGNIFNDTRIVYFAGEPNLEHTNRVYQNLLSLSDEFENSYFTDLSDIAMMVEDQRRFRSDKAVYSGENPILVYRSGESERFIDLMQSEYRQLIPFSVDELRVSLNFSDIDRAFFQSYDEMGFKSIMTLLEALIENTKDEVERASDRKLSERALEIVTSIKGQGIGGFLNQKFYDYEDEHDESLLRINFYHHLLLRHIREQLMETLGELTEDNKLSYYISLVSDLEKHFLTDKTYLEQIKDYLSNTTLGNDFTGKVNLKAVEEFCQKVDALQLWDKEQLQITLAKGDVINSLTSAIRELDKGSKLKYKPSTILNLNLMGLSTGERQFLKIFSRFLLYQLNNKPGGVLKVQNFILLIDEFEIGFHPLWQRKFLKSWILFLERYVNQVTGNVIKVQIILTSHSPFIVSDLPKPCINFLSKKEGEIHSKVDRLNKHHATFGANIHDLFSDSFFLTGALMGDFAKDKLDAAFRQLSEENSSQDLSTVASLIEFVGEPIIRTKLAEMYANRLGGNVEYARLRAQQEYINQRLREIERDDSN